MTSALTPRPDPGQEPSAEEHRITAEPPRFLQRAPPSVILRAQKPGGPHGHECDDRVMLLRLLRDQLHRVRARLRAERLVETQHIRAAGATDGPDDNGKGNDARQEHGTLPVDA